MKIIYDKVKMPEKNTDYIPVELTMTTMEEHRKKVIAKMVEKELDILLIYADREHGSNYAYLTGFEPRFEESILVLHSDGRCFLLLGNENMKMCQYSFIKAKAIHVPHFSLPYQPMENEKNLDELFQEAGIRNHARIGFVGWKLFTSLRDRNEELLDAPAFIVDTVRRLNPEGSIRNAAEIFLDPAKGVRIYVNANEIAHYEYGAGLASAKMLEALNAVQPGKTELELADLLSACAQPLTVTTICASGERFTDAVVFPRNKKVQIGDKFSMTLGLRGGLTSRAAYVANTEKDLPDTVKDYLERVAIPYYRAAVTWYELVGIGVSGKDIYDGVEKVLPRKKYNWVLNPGHSTGADEWISSPVYPESSVHLASGMMLQMDIIPSVSGYGGANAEDGIAIADANLRAELKKEYPETWKRIQKRRRYMEEELKICLKEEILPLSDMCGYMRPYLLNHEYALKKG